MRFIHKTLGYFLCLVVLSVPFIFAYQGLREFQISLGVYQYRGEPVVPQARAHTADDVLAFDPKLPDVTLSFHEQNYKEIRAKEICDMAKEAGIGAYCRELIAHLARECGSMTEYCGWEPGKSSNDHGWAVGLAQWHIWYRYRDWAVQNHFTYTYNVAKVTAMRDKFFADHPEMKDWSGQAHKYIAEMAGCISSGRTVWSCIDSWNANPAYLSQVREQLALADRLLSPL